MAMAYVCVQAQLKSVHSLLCDGNNGDFAIDVDACLLLGKMEWLLFQRNMANVCLDLLPFSLLIYLTLN